MAKKQIEYKFVCINEPDSDCIKRFHTAIAKALINTYGVDCIKAVLTAMDKKA